MNESSPLILVVEDDAQMRRFLRVSITSNGYRLVEAETARDALAQAAARSPDLVLLDLGLPDEDGGEKIASLVVPQGVPPGRYVIAVRLTADMNPARTFFGASPAIEVK